MRSTLFALVLLGFALWFWSEARRYHERAVRVVKRAVSNSGAQLLDDTVSLRSLGLARTSSGRMGLRRTYSFELSFDRVNRKRGSLTLLGRHNEILELPEADETDMW